jgi:4-hydroxybenzoate polyprenyltransferase
MSTIKSYLSLVKFSHTVFAMPFALVGFMLGASMPLSVVPGWHSFVLPLNHPFPEDSLIYQYAGGANFWLLFFKYLALVILCMVFARSAAMAFNRYLDSAFDAKNPRTAIREIPAGIISKSSALRFVLFNSLAFVVTTFFINRLCFYLSPVALLVVLGYSYTKRFTPLCHLVLGLGLSLAPIGAYLAVTGVFHLLPVLFSLLVLFWVSGFDIIYALQDEAFDKSNKLYSIPAVLGKKNALRVSELLHVCCAILVVVAGWYGNFGGWYWAGASLFIVFLIYQHLLVKPTDLSKVNLAFFTSNGIASVAFGLLVIIDLLF